MWLRGRCLKSNYCLCDGKTQSCLAYLIEDNICVGLVIVGTVFLLLRSFFASSFLHRCPAIALCSSLPHHLGGQVMAFWEVFDFVHSALSIMTIGFMFGNQTFLTPKVLWKSQTSWGSLSCSSSSPPFSSASISLWTIITDCWISSVRWPNQFFVCSIQRAPNSISTYCPDPNITRSCESPKQNVHKTEGTQDSKQENGSNRL